MKQAVNFNQFEDSFSESYKNNFSYEGKQSLFNYLEEYEESTGEEIELDTIALCCEYSEYDSFKKLKEDYNNIKTMEDLEDNTQVIEVEDYAGNKTGGLIIQQF